MTDKGKRPNRKQPDFRGQYCARVMGCGRICIPQEAQRQLEHNGVREALIGIIPEKKALAIATEEMIDEWFRFLREQAGEIKANDFERFILSSYSKITWDKKGRFTLPEACREHLNASIGKLLLFVGAGYRFELWSDDAYQGERRAFMENLQESGSCSDYSLPKEET